MNPSGGDIQFWERSNGFNLFGFIHFTLKIFRPGVISRQSLLIDVGLFVSEQLHQKGGDAGVVFLQLISAWTKLMQYFSVRGDPSISLRTKGNLSNHKQLPFDKLRANGRTNYNHNFAQVLII